MKRFIPSEFANHPDYEGLPEFDGAKMAKVGVMDHLRAKAETNKGFTWTAFAIGNFFDWVCSFCSFLPFPFLAYR